MELSTAKSQVPDDVYDLIGTNPSDADLKTAIPRIAKNPDLIGELEQRVLTIPSMHDVRLGDARKLQFIQDESVHLVVTSPPYWTLKQYVGSDGQMGDIADYDEFLTNLNQVWQHCYRVLVPGGRLIVVVGDVCLSRREHGRHAVIPLHASIQEGCREIGFDNLAPIIWHKIANAKFEANGSGGGFLGKPYEPNAVIKNDIEFILMQRKPSGYRKPKPENRLLSIIGEQRQREWFRQIWTVGGASTKNHPAPYPAEIAERLIRMFSFVGDTVLDPFLGSGTTTLAAGRWARNSIGVEIEPDYLDIISERLSHDFGMSSSAAELSIKR